MFKFFMQGMKVSPNQNTINIIKFLIAENELSASDKLLNKFVLDNPHDKAVRAQYGKLKRQIDEEKLKKPAQAPANNHSTKNL